MRNNLPFNSARVVRNYTERGCSCAACTEAKAHNLSDHQCLKDFQCSQSQSRGNFYGY